MREYLLRSFCFSGFVTIGSRHSSRYCLLDEGYIDLPGLWRKRVAIGVWNRQSGPSSALIKKRGGETAMRRHIW